LYFSAHWCPPCRQFTPLFAKTYQKLKDDGKKFEVIFISSDRGQKDFDDYFKEMPWLALPYDRRTEKTQLSELFEVEGIPTLVTLEAKTGKVISLEARDYAADDSEGLNFPWAPPPPKPLEKLDEKGYNHITSSDVMCAIVFAEGEEKESAEVLRQSLSDLATPLFVGPNGSESKIRFFFADSSCKSIAGFFRNICQIPDERVLPVPSGENVKCDNDHVLKPVDRGYGCDRCKKSAGDIHWACLGCDYDVCTECLAPPSCVPAHPTAGVIVQLSKNQKISVPSPFSFDNFKSIVQTHLNGTAKIEPLK